MISCLYLGMWQKTINFVANTATLFRILCRTIYVNGFTRHSNTTDCMCIVGSSDSIANVYNSVLAKQEKQKAEYDIDIFISFCVYIYFLFRIPDRWFYLLISLRHRLRYRRALSYSVAKRL